jgi:hypothetical protein
MQTTVNLTSVTTRPGVVTNNHEAGTRIGERSIQRTLVGTPCKVSILRHWLFVLCPMWLRHLVLMRMLYLCPPGTLFLWYDLLFIL